MKILIVEERGYKWGGGQVYALALMKALTKQGHTVKLFASDENGGGSADFTYRRVEISSPFRFIPYVFNVSAYRQLKRAIASFHPDVVHINALFYHASPSVLFALSGTPTVMTLHNADLICPLPDSTKADCKHTELNYCRNCIGTSRYIAEKLKRAILTRGIKNVQEVLVPSMYMKQLYDERRVLPAPISHLPNGFDESHQVLPDLAERNGLVVVARLASDKGVATAIEAMPLILKSIPNTHLTVIGDGSERESLVQMADHLGVSNSITFTGYVDNGEIPGYLRKAKALIVPSICKENLPTVCIEAMFAATPIIASNIGGLPEMVIDGQNGYLFKAGDETSLADALIRLYSDQDLQQQFSVKCLELSARYKMSFHTRVLLETYSLAANIHSSTERRLRSAE